VLSHEHRIGRRQQVLMPEVLGSLPRALHRVDENQSAWRSSAEFVVRDRIRCEANDVGKRRRVQRGRCRCVEFGWCRGDVGK
jgi:hypothetical protein